MKLREINPHLKDWAPAIPRDMGRIFENEALKHRALSLYAEDACRIVSLDSRELTARVTGRGGVYWTSLYREDGGIYFDCDCPSDYYPCKHAGALLYTLREMCSAADGSGSPQAAAVGGGVRREEGFSPGEVLEVRNAGGESTTGGQRGGRDHDFFFAQEGFGERAGTVSETGRYRPAFRIVHLSESLRPSKGVLGIEPVLVYLRRDGTDGRLDKFSPGKGRRPGDEETEQLLRLCCSVDGRTRRAKEVLKSWYYRSLWRGIDQLHAPVELYLERAGRLERERPAELRKIERMTIRWTALRYQHQALEFGPRIYLVDRDGYEELFDDTESAYESDEELLLLTKPATGSLWYLFETPTTEESGARVGVFSAVLSLPRYFGVEEIRRFSEKCRSHYRDLLEVEELPRDLNVISLVPTPVLDFQPDGEITSLSLSFRYGREELAPGGDALIRVSTEEARELTGAPSSANAQWYIAAKPEAEYYFVDLLDRLFLEKSIPLQIYTWRNPFFESPRRKADLHDLSRAPQFFVEAELRELATELIGELLQRGFEVRVQREKIARALGPASVRVGSSGEEWLDIEPGLETDEGFVPIEGLNVRGLCEAGGKKYVLPPGSDVQWLLSILGGKKIGRLDLASIEELIDRVSNPEHPGLQDYFALRERLASFEGLEEISAPANFHGLLRSYQRSGLSWLWFLHRYRLGGCLADDMGLGKTIQALALLAKAREIGEMKRALVVCPVSTLGNWKREVGRFTPHFSVGIHAGSDRRREAAEFDDLDLVFVSYATLQRDAELLRRVEFDYLILDEAQAIKNPKAKRRRAVASIDAAHRLALTGTPVENNVIELWSLIDILMPGILGRRGDFSRRYGRQIEEGSAVLGAQEEVGEAMDRLQRLIRPLILRRTKRAVAPELPPKEEFVDYVEAGKKQAELYESLRRRFAEEVEQLLASGDGGRSAMKILEAMLRLRQTAILPALVDRDYSRVPSAKLDTLYDRIVELQQEGNKALVFSQFTGVLDEVERRLGDLEIRLFRLDGSTPQQQRESAIDGFQHSEGAALFLISLKAGGVGINLTAADYVFLLDPWWNPAVESQAVDRAHRIGRQGAVFVYRLVTRGTIEEKMLRLQERKLRISESLIRGESGALRELSPEDIMGLFQ